MDKLEGRHGDFAKTVNRRGSACTGCAAKRPRKRVVRDVCKDLLDMTGGGLWVGICFDMAIDIRYLFGSDNGARTDGTKKRKDFLPCRSNMEGEKKMHKYHEEWDRYGQIPIVRITKMDKY